MGRCDVGEEGVMWGGGLRGVMWGRLLPHTTHSSLTLPLPT